MSINDPFRVCLFLFWPNFPQYNNCSPSFCFLNLLKLWYLLLFSKRKFQKNKKKAGNLKILLANISTMGALHSMIETDLGSCSAGLPFSFFSHFKQQVMWPHSWWPMGWTLKARENEVTTLKKWKYDWKKCQKEWNIAWNGCQRGMRQNLRENEVATLMQWKLDWNKCQAEWNILWNNCQRWMKQNSRENEVPTMMKWKFDRNKCQEEWNIPWNSCRGRMR